MKGNGGGASGCFASWSQEVRGWDDLALRGDDPTEAIEITVFRHGETAANASGLVSGISDVPLTSRGRAQAQHLGGELHGYYDAAFHSPLLRSRDTLALATGAADCEVGSTHVDGRIVERSMGALEGAPSRPIAAYDEGDLGWAPPGGEPYVLVTQRILSFLRDLEACAGGSSGLRVLVSTHVGPMRVLLAILDEIASPATMMSAQYGNALAWRRKVHTSAWAHFVDPGMVGLT